jgi:hypothetical protein
MRAVPTIETRSRYSQAAALVAAIIVAGTATVIFHLSPQVPLGVPWDEPGKVSQVLHNYNDFNHPLLMLQIVRLANVWGAANDPTSVLELGRIMAAVSGGLLVFVAIALARSMMGVPAALGAGVLTAVPPLTVLHSQLFKEDVFVAPWLILGVLVLDEMRKSPTTLPAVLFGIAAGLAASAKYVGVVLVPLCLLLPLWAQVRPSNYYRMAIFAIGVGFATFCIVNFPAFMAPRVFVASVINETRHSLTGHVIAHYGWYSNFAFTWSANLWPGLCAPLAIAGAIGALIVAFQGRASPPKARTLLVFGLAWYLMHELSPAKPFPEGARHMTVVAAVFAVFSAFAAEFLGRRLLPVLPSLATMALIVGVSVVPAMRSFELTRSAPNDTQLVAERLVKSLRGSTAWSAGLGSTAWSAVRDDRLWVHDSQPLEVIEKSVDFLVINELRAQTYIFSLTLSGQRGTRQTAVNYDALLRRPALLITSSAGRFAFRNVPVRIIALQGDPRELDRAVMRFKSVPDIELRIVSD